MNKHKEKIMDWNAFNPLAALAGGALIGLASLLLLLMLGRIAGISGILGGLLRRPDTDTPWRLAFLIGLPLGALAAAQLLGGFIPRLVTDTPGLIVAGLLVGYGTRLGAGCTSGHGICGLARLSPRSLAAVVIFMASAMATVFVTRHLIGG
ncbi:YeeE/YedE family protein [Dongia sp.]|uniref:YeeE/YedE family protein n=1 Tax=Dongia sp. TaxID=1977262 RepID=UPI0035AED345